jgi:hypothetical protein
MRNVLLVIALLTVFVAAPGAILAFHSAPPPPRVNPAAEQLLTYINGLDLASVDCWAIHRRVICTVGTRADGEALGSALDETSRFSGDCETRKHRTVCIVGSNV